MTWLANRVTGPVKKLLVCCCLIAGSYLIADGGWIYAKALLAQELIERAWFKSIEQGKAVKPWPWADTWPVGRLQSKQLDIDLYVLSGGHGSALAFGPGLVNGGDNRAQSLLMAGHRDTHFGFLKQLKEGDELQFTNKSGYRQSYTVTELGVEESEGQQLQIVQESASVGFGDLLPF